MAIVQLIKSDLQVQKILLIDGNRSVVGDEFQVLATIEVDGSRPIVASSLEVDKTLGTDGDRPLLQAIGMSKKWFMKMADDRLPRIKFKLARRFLLRAIAPLLWMSQKSRICSETILTCNDCSKFGGEFDLG
jgi:hypothetical protein